MVKAVVLVNTEPRRTERVFEETRKSKTVIDAIQVYGEYDMAFVVQCLNTVGVQNFVKALRTKKGVLRTVTLIEIV